MLLEFEENTQYLFKEIPFSALDLEKIACVRDDDEEITEEERKKAVVFNKFKIDLVARVFELIEIHMTEHQKKVIALMLKSLTYNTMATLLCVNYTAIANAIKGIKTKKHGKYHGGIERKLQKICSKDELCLEILVKMNKFRQGEETEESRQLFDNVSY